MTDDFSKYKNVLRFFNIRITKERINEKSPECVRYLNSIIGAISQLARVHEQVVGKFDKGSNFISFEYLTNQNNKNDPK